MTLDILYKDDYFVAINKPSGVFVHPTDLDRNALSCMPILRDQLGQWVYPVHRLDRGTSGVLLFALSSEIAHEIMLQFDGRDVHKEYLAVVRGFCLSQVLSIMPIVHPIWLSLLMPLLNLYVKQRSSWLLPWAVIRRRVIR